MEQLVFELSAPESPSFENFVVGPNAEVLAATMRFAAGETLENGLLLWGAESSGKTHLLLAAVRRVAERGARAVMVARPEEVLAANIAELAAATLVAVDAIDTASAEAQARLFTLYNALKANAGRLVAASRLPLAALPLRDDVRTRLGWGLVYEVAPLADADKPAALSDYARQRGFALPDDVIRYLLAHGRRDMATLRTTLASLDRHSLATKRAITIPLLREWLQREMPMNGTAGG